MESRRSQTTILLIKFEALSNSLQLLLLFCSQKFHLLLIEIFKTKDLIIKNVLKIICKLPFTSDIVSEWYISSDSKDVQAPKFEKAPGCSY